MSVWWNCRKCGKALRLFDDWGMDMVCSECRQTKRSKEKQKVKTTITKFGTCETITVDTEKEQCGTCKYFIIKPAITMCRRYPPQSTVFPDSEAYPGFLAVNSTMWCGEWRKGDE